MGGDGGVDLLKTGKESGTVLFSTRALEDRKYGF